VALRQPGTVGYTTADGEAEGQIRVRPAADQVATEDGDDADAADEAQPAAALPNTGQPAGILLGFALLLVGFGAITLHRADALQVRVGAVRH
jgi:plasmid stabilization system protein ParE